MTKKLMKNSVLILFSLAVASACQPAGPPQPGSEPVAGAVVPASIETKPTAGDGANDAAILINSANPAASLILGADTGGGLELYRLDGSLAGAMNERRISLVDVRYNFPLGGSDTALIMAYDSTATELVAYRLGDDGQSLIQVSGRAIETKAEIEGLCLYQSPLSGKFYAFAAGKGMIQQWEIYDQNGSVAARKIRDMPVGLGAAHCAVHDADSALYYSQETVGVWKLNAEPESEAEAEAISLAEPHGPFVGDVKGIAIYEHQDGGGVLMVSDADISTFQLIDLSTHERLGHFTVAAHGGIGSVDESEGIAITSMPLSDEFPRGLAVVTDDYNDGNNTNYKVLSWADIASGLGLPESAGTNPTLKLESLAVTVSPSVETEPVKSYGDAADDPAIWVHPDDAAQSMIIGSQKQHGINVYALDGSLLQSLADGRINNVDLRYGFSLQGKPVDIVAGTNRTTDSISIYGVNPVTRTLENLADGVIATGMLDPYGLCMYRSPKTGSFYVFVNDTDGLVKQFELRDNGSGRVAAESVREFKIETQTEGCVADDETGVLYVGEEDVGIWKYSAEPDGGEDRSMVDSTEDGNITDDVEGLSIYYAANGEGYLIASNQGADSYAVYERSGENRFIGLFHVVADEATGIDGASETDGLDVTSANLGPAFPNGVFVVQDGRNITPDERQNFKLVPWERIARAMGLETYNGYDPRAASSNP